jgi:ATP-dependent DNA helicase RecG
MNFDEIQAHAARGESEQQEFKKSTGDLRGGMESLCGFLNGLGGRVLFGVNSSGRVVGQGFSDATSQEIARELRRLEPAADVRQHLVELTSASKVIVLETGDRSQSPYTFDGRAFQRIGTTTSLMPQEDYQRRLLERGHSQQRWENQAARGYNISDLDEEEIARTVTEALSARRLDSAATSALEVLGRLKLADDRGVIQAAVVAFAKEVLPGYPQCALRMARFRGTSKDEFLDQRQITGHAFKLLDEAMLFLSRHLPVAGRFEPGVITRIDEPLFPTLALREAVVNALCHRDDAIAGGSISIAIYDDRLEITSTGTLPFGLTVDDLKRDHISRPRERRSSAVEKAGAGAIGRARAR